MEQFKFASPRGHELAARYDGPAVPRATAIFAHCFTCSKDLRVERQIVSALVAQGIGVLSFDFAGLGRSGGDFGSTTFSADVDDILAASDILGSRVAPPAILVGHSLGGAAVLHAAGRIASCKAVVTVGAPADPAHVKHLFADGISAIKEKGRADVSIGGRTFSISKSFVDDIERADAQNVVNQLDRALLVFHSPIDELVGIENARILYDAARHPKSFISLDGADHLLTNPEDAAYVASVTAAWASRYVDIPSTDSSTPVQMSAEKYDSNVVRAATSDGFRTEVLARGFVLHADEPASVGGTQTGPTPYDFLGASLAACTSMTLRMYADRKKLNLSEVRTSVTHSTEHAKDCANCDSHESRIAVLTRTIELIGDLDDATRHRLLQIADKCPVHRTLVGKIEVRTSAHVE